MHGHCHAVSLRQIADGNLCVEVNLRGNDRSSLLYAMHTMRERLTEIMRSNRAMTVPPEALRFGNVRDAVLNKVRINWRDADPGFVADVGLEGCEKFEFRDCRFEKGTREI